MTFDRKLLEGMPFPLASVLWDYESGAGRRALDPLFNFLEVAAKFATIVLLSGLRRDTAAFEEARRSWQGRVPPSELMKTPTFGAWTRLHAGAAKALRALAHADGPRITQMFLVDRASRIEAIASRAVVGLLEDAVKYRNEWRGHGSIASPGETARRRQLLQACASSIAIELAGAFEGWTLFAPHSGTVRNGRYEYLSDVLVGANARFAERAFDLSRPVETDRLHLLCEGTDEALALVPLLALSHPADSSDPAIYFYDRLDKTVARWLSYHYEPTPEFSEQAPPDLPLFLEHLDAGESPPAAPDASEQSSWPQSQSSQGSLKRSPIALLRAGAGAAGLSVAPAKSGEVFSFNGIELAWMHALGDEYVLTATVAIDAAPYLPGAVLTEVSVGPGGSPSTRLSIRTELDALDAFRLIATAVATHIGWELPSRSLDAFLARAEPDLSGSSTPIVAWGMGWKRGTIDVSLMASAWEALAASWSANGFRRSGLATADALRLHGVSGQALEFRVDAYGVVVAVSFQRPDRRADRILAHRRDVAELLGRQVAWIDFVSAVQARVRPYPIGVQPSYDPEDIREIDRAARALMNALMASADDEGSRKHRG